MLKTCILSRSEKGAVFCFVQLTGVFNDFVCRLEFESAGGVGGMVCRVSVGWRGNCIEIFQILHTLSHSCKGILAEVSQTAGERT
jgi:hypothetical protein